ncbi:MAG: putative P-type ATPase, partial [Streblomastix strix]
IKYVDFETFQQWNTIHYEKAQASVDRREERVNQACDIIETDLTPLGTTGISDKLQDQATETITDLRKAGIRFWMLTGDQWDTAIQVAQTCSLLSPNKIIIKGNDPVHILNCFRSIRFNKQQQNIENTEQENLVGQPLCLPRPLTVLISGSTFSTAIDSPLVKDDLKNLLTYADTVICSRTAPAQKMKIVNFAKKPVVLSIGDGGNDVPMIQSAHIGVGIEGKEGKQASMAADFVIVKFSHLKRLLLWHGHHSLRRISLVILFSIQRYRQ